jgi:DNA-binding NarL/FixJ family response regulator
LAFSVPALLVGRPGHMLDGLRSVIKAYLKLDPLYTSEDVDQAVKLTRKNDIKVVLLDSSLFEEVTLQVVEQIKLQKPEVKCVVLTDKALFSRAAKSFGADMVLPTSTPSAQLFAEIDRLIKMLA